MLGPFFPHLWKYLLVFGDLAIEIFLTLRDGVQVFALNCRQNMYVTTYKYYLVLENWL
jgi:hypothetical protein